MHDDESSSPPRAYSRNGRVESQPGHVVHDMRTSIERGARDIALHCIDRYDRVRTLTRELFDDWNDAALFLTGRHRDRALGSRGFPADVDDIRPFVDHLDCVTQGVRGGQEATPVGEAVGG